MLGAAVGVAVVGVIVCPAAGVDVVIAGSSVAGLELVAGVVNATSPFPTLNT